MTALVCPHCGELLEEIVEEGNAAVLVRQRYAWTGQRYELVDGSEEREQVDYFFDGYYCSACDRMLDRKVVENAMEHSHVG